jgi:hypothetical protein
MPRPGGKSEVPAMSPGASPDSDAPNVDFPPGSETRKDHLENRNKMRIFCSFPSFLLQAHDAHKYRKRRTDKRDKIPSEFFFVFLSEAGGNSFCEQKQPMKI